MSVVKSFSVGNGDMFYIQHNSDNFSIIDCCLSEDNQKTIVDEILDMSVEKGITRFISTHPDEDHICGLGYLNDRLTLLNFYCVKNEATKTDESDDFEEYCELRDSSKKAFYIYKGCSRRWMNLSDEVRKTSGIEILWPKTENDYFKEALENVKNGGSPNNISPIVKYSVENGARIMWMGDLETDFMENIEEDLDLENIDILFAPHHGRASGKVPKSILDKLSPKLVIIGEAPSANLNYYKGYNTITQNLAGDITLECVTGKVHIYVSNENYKAPFLSTEKASIFSTYIGTLIL